MKTKRPTLISTIIFAIVAAVVLAAGLVWGFFGLNTSIGYSGGTELQITCQNQEDATAAKQKVAQVLEQNGIKFEVVEKTNGAEFAVVFETKSKNIGEDIKTEVDNAVSDIEFVQVSDFEEIVSTFKTQSWVIAVTISCLALAVCIALFVLTRKWADILSFAIGFVSTGISIFALYVVCRIQFNRLSVFGFVFALVAYTIISVLVAIRTKSARSKASNAQKNEYALSCDASRTSLAYDLPVLCISLVASIVCIIFGATEVRHFGAGLVLALATAVVMSYFLFGGMRAFFETAFENRYQDKKNVTVTVSQAKQEAKPQKQERPKAVKRPQVVVKKRKRRNGSNDKVVV